jgi:hypothetical protein
MKNDVLYGVILTFVAIFATSACVWAMTEWTDGRVQSTYLPTHTDKCVRYTYHLQIGKVLIPQFKEVPCERPAPSSN